MYWLVFNRLIDVNSSVSLDKVGDCAYELIFTINEVFEGRYVKNFERVIQQSNQAPFFDAFREKYRLSRREAQILKMISEGMPNKEIADSLSLSVQTIETHRKNINQKLQVSSLMDLINKVNEMNL